MIYRLLLDNEKRRAYMLATENVAVMDKLLLWITDGLVSTDDDGEYITPSGLLSGYELGYELRVLSVPLSKEEIQGMLWVDISDYTFIEQDTIETILNAKSRSSTS